MECDSGYRKDHGREEGEMTCTWCGKGGWRPHTITSYLCEFIHSWVDGSARGQRYCILILIFHHSFHLFCDNGIVNKSPVFTKPTTRLRSPLSVSD